MTTAEYVHFVELASATAPEQLAPQAERWRSEGAACHLLVSDEQPDLWLLVATAATPPSAPTVAGARVWRFRAALEVAP